MPSAQLLAGLGAAAIVVANVVALRQERLKLLVAYSTVAQIGYLFLMFPLAFDAGGIAHGGASTGGLLQAISHATAKAAMFMAAGLVYVALGHDRIAGLAGVGQALPLTVLTFALAGIALMGLPPSGAYVAKKLFFDAATGSGQWWWERVLDVGGLLTASYVVLVLAHALRRADAPIALKKPVSRLAELAALALALCSLALGFVADGALGLDALSSLLALSDLGSAVLVLFGGAVIAAGLARDLPPRSGGGGPFAFARPLRNATVAIGGAFACADGMLRRWPVGGLALLAATIAFGATLLARS
jgi:NADH:ubiquinone oxidoreductase subunit 5 (subunit L)/multisubunit Na+/H+ antiporter MnhA subunit